VNQLQLQLTGAILLHAAVLVRECFAVALRDHVHVLPGLALGNDREPRVWELHTLKLRRQPSQLPSRKRPEDWDSAQRALPPIELPFPPALFEDRPNC
jgi:hypothetical protein